MVIRVEVVYAASADEHWSATVELPDGATVRDALDASGVFARFPRIGPASRRVGRFRHPASVTAPGAALPPASLRSSRDAGAPLYLGIFGEPVAPGDAVHDGDRVEIYRPLVADPKEIRRRRAATKGK